MRHVSSDRQARLPASRSSGAVMRALCAEVDEAAGIPQIAVAQPVSDCWYSVNPIALQTAATIQKRRMIFVSDHARSSKWWWIGAIRKTRFLNAWNDATWISTDSAS